MLLWASFQAEEVGGILGIGNNLRSFTTSLANNPSVAVAVMGNDAIDK